MNPTEKPTPFVPSASEYILDNFAHRPHCNARAEPGFRRNHPAHYPRAESRKPRIPSLASLQERERLEHRYRDESA
jgi:hypothetical protein